MKKLFFSFLWLILQQMPNLSTHTKELIETDVLTDLEEPCHLIMWNDEVNTFEWVIETLIDICDQAPEQAEQCAWLIHSKGKYAVKNGSYDDLKPLCDAITDRGIGATVEVIA
jgi:ATP-dependent Clp protease adaptor protein ClpS